MMELMVEVNHPPRLSWRSRRNWTLETWRRVVRMCWPCRKALSRLASSAGRKGGPSTEWGLVIGSREYKDFLVVGNHRPVLDSGEKLCTSCFGKGDKLVAEATALASDLDSPSSVSSSTSLGSPSSDED